MIEQIIHIDQQIFHFINQEMSNPFFDAVMPWLRYKYTWVPLYVGLAVFLFVKYKWRALPVILGVLAVFGLGDFISNAIIKPWIDRLRPCNDPVFREQVRLLITCGPGYSFTSNHATNHFGMAVFFIFVFYHKWKWVLPVALLWAFLIVYAQIYVGVHYPVDIVGGAILGSLLAGMVWPIYSYFTRKYNVDIT